MRSPVLLVASEIPQALRREGRLRGVLHEVATRPPCSGRWPRPCSRRAPPPRRPVPRRRARHRDAAPARTGLHGRALRRVGPRRRPAVPPRGGALVRARARRGRPRRRRRGSRREARRDLGGHRCRRRRAVGRRARRAPRRTCGDQLRRARCAADRAPGRGRAAPARARGRRADRERRGAARGRRRPGRHEHPQLDDARPPRLVTLDPTPPTDPRSGRRTPPSPVGSARRCGAA